MTAPNIEMIASSLRNCSLNGGGGGGRRRGRRHASAAAEGSDDSEVVTVELNSEVALPYHWEQCLDIRTGQVYYINWEDGTRTTVDPRLSSPSAYSSPSPPSRSASSSSRRCSRSRRAAAAASTTTSSGYTSVSSVGAAWRSHDASGHTGTYAGGYGGYGYNGGGYGYGYGYDGGDGDDEESSSSSSSASSSSRGSAVSSTLSSFSPTDESASGGAGSGYGGNGNGNGHVLVAAGCRACFMYFMVPKSADVCPKCGSSGLLHLSRNGYV